MYHKGIENRAVDALSWHPSPPAICATITSLIPSWIASVTATYDHDPFAQELIAKLAVPPDAVPHFTFQAGVLRYRNHIWVGSDAALQLCLM